MLSKLQDITQEFNASNAYVMELAGWDYATFQFIGGSTITLEGSNDGGASSNTTTATNFVAVQATNLTSGAAGSSVGGGSLFRLNVSSQYVRVSGVDVTKALVFFQKVF